MAGLRRVCDVGKCQLLQRRRSVFCLPALAIVLATLAKFSVVVVAVSGGGVAVVVVGRADPLGRHWLW